MEHLACLVRTEEMEGTVVLDEVVTQEALELLARLGHQESLEPTAARDWMELTVELATLADRATPGDLERLSWEHPVNLDQEEKMEFPAWMEDLEAL